MSANPAIDRDSHFSLHSLMPFGKYKDLPIGDIIVRDPRYVEWALSNVGFFKLDDEASTLFEQKMRW